MARRNLEQWQSIIEQHQQSGLTIVEFCKQQNISTKSFYARRRVLLKRKQNASAIPFFKVSKTPANNEMMALQFGDAKLSLPITTEPDWLARLIKALSA